MAFDIIVFNQEELINALEAGARSIALCDNSFALPEIEGIHYTIIGNVTIEDMEISTEDIPAYANVPQEMMAYGNGSFNISHSSYFGSSSYGVSSYNSGSGASYQNSYNYEYEYSLFSSSYASSYAALQYISSYETSFSSSYYSFISGMTFEFGASFGFTFAGSFGGSYSYSYGFGGSYGGSFSGSYGYGGSYGFGLAGYAGSYAGSFSGSYALLPDIIEYGSSGIIFVNGYGINLI